MNIEGKTAVVTGGASGLGESAVRRLCSLGANVVIADLNDERGQQLEKELGEKALYAKTDITSAESVQALYAAAVNSFGTVHILVNSAGVGTLGKNYRQARSFGRQCFQKNHRCELDRYL